MPLGLDTKSIAVGIVLGLFVVPVVLGKVRAVTSKK